MSAATWQADDAIAPQSGFVSVFATSTTAASQNLALCGYQTANLGNAITVPPMGLPGHWVRFEAETADVGIIFAPTQALVTGANAPVLTTAGVNTAGCCIRIPAGGYRQWRIRVGTDVWMGYVGAASGVLRVYQVSP